MFRFLMFLFSVVLFVVGVYVVFSVYFIGVICYDLQKVFNQYVIFSGVDCKIYLIDMNGNEVKCWDYFGFFVVVIDLVLNGGKCGYVLL